MTRPQRIGAAVAATMLGCLFAAAVLEVGVTLALGTQVRFPRHVVGAPFGVRINEPGASYTHTSADLSVSFAINAQGMRADRDYEYAKPPGLLRIVSLGDSFAAGYEVEDDESFVRVIERELRAAGLDVEVLNAGVSGYSNAEAALYLERELMRYSPDLVLVSFYGNDLVDNVRSGLFAVEDGALVQKKESYVPAGGLGNFLNTNFLFNFLSEHSNAFTLLKERLTLLVKRQIVARNVAALDRADDQRAGDGNAAGVASEGQALAAAIFERIRGTTREAGIPLVIQSIPSRRYEPLRLVELFPLESFPIDREGLSFFAAKRVLDPWVGRELLYYERSHGHWTPRAHQVTGEALAALILDQGLLGPAAH